MSPAAPAPTHQKWAQTRGDCARQLAKGGQASWRGGFTQLQGVVLGWGVMLGDRCYLFPCVRPLLSGLLRSPKHRGQSHKCGNVVAAVPRPGSLWESTAGVQLRGFEPFPPLHASLLAGSYGMGPTFLVSRKSGSIFLVSIIQLCHSAGSQAVF